MRVIWCRAAAGVVTLAASVSAAAPVAAHPHVTIKVETAVVVEDGKVTGLRHRWTFDAAYLSSILEEFDADANRQLDQPELAGLLASTRDTLKQFGAFTVAWSGVRKLKLRAATEIAMTFVREVPVLQFNVALAKPVSVHQAAFRIEVYDATYFSAFDLVGTTAVSRTGAAVQACTSALERPPEGEQLKAYRAFVREFGAEAAKPVVPTVATLSCRAG